MSTSSGFRCGAPESISVHLLCHARCLITSNGEPATYRCGDEEFAMIITLFRCGGGDKYNPTPGYAGGDLLSESFCV